MSDQLSLFDSDDSPSAETAVTVSKMMTPSQRDAIKRSFVLLGVSDAGSQFSIVHELIGLSIASVKDLNFVDAQQLIYRLDDKARTSRRKNTGNAWDDREEDTWIDKL